nr:uncharacterized protein LOC129271296 [Lytechinus pictus]
MARVALCDHSLDKSTSTQDETTTTTDSTTTLSTTAANSESTSTQEDMTTTTTATLSTTAADAESTSTQDDTTTTTTTLSTNAADSVSDEKITTEGSTNPQYPPAPPGWKCTSSKCYRLYDEQERVWADAKAFCSGLDPVNTANGYRSPSLLFLNTEKEANDLLALQLNRQ